MEQCARQGKQSDPFLLSTDDPMNCKLLEDVGLAWGDPKRKLPQLGPDRLETSKRRSQMARSMRRLLMSLLGGLALLAPFLIIELIAGQLVRLIATSAFTMFFAVLLALGSDTDPDRLALVIAAYAAALVVFVGTNPPSYLYS